MTRTLTIVLAALIAFAAGPVAARSHHHRVRHAVSVGHHRHAARTRRHASLCQSVTVRHHQKTQCR